MVSSFPGGSSTKVNGMREEAELEDGVSGWSSSVLSVVELFPVSH